MISHYHTMCRDEDMSTLLAKMEYEGWEASLYQIVVIPPGAGWTSPSNMHHIIWKKKQ